MNPKEYIEKVLITESVDFISIFSRTNKAGNIRLLHAAFGMNTEQAEFMDALKKFLFYGRDLDRTNLLEELGDQLWYVAIALDQLGSSFEEVMEKNINKLQARYKGKFNEVDAKNRNLELERLILQEEANTAEREAYKGESK